MADEGVVAKKPEIAGYTDIDFERIEAPLLVGSNADEAVEFQLDVGPAGEVYREAGELAQARRGEIVAALKMELARQRRRASCSVELVEGVGTQSRLTGTVSKNDRRSTSTIVSDVD